MCRKLVYLISFVLVLSAAGDVYASLVSHWTLDDGSGNIAKDSAGSSAGIVRGGAAWVAGEKGGALQFDGSNDCVDVGNNPAFNPTGSFSVALWANIGNWSTEWLHSRT
jgi:hypothetical protein